MSWNDYHFVSAWPVDAEADSRDHPLVDRAMGQLVMRHGHFGLRVFLAGQRFGARGDGGRHTPGGGGARQG